MTLSREVLFSLKKAFSASSFLFGMATPHFHSGPYNNNMQLVCRHCLLPYLPRFVHKREFRAPLFVPAPSSTAPETKKGTPNIDLKWPCVAHRRRRRSYFSENVRTGGGIEVFFVFIPIHRLGDDDFPDNPGREQIGGGPVSTELGSMR